MSIDYKKFLPTRMRDTRWGQFIEVIQDIIETIKREKIRPIFDQFNINKASYDELLDYAFYFGYKILTLKGLTSTKEYLKKQIISIVPKIIYKTTARAFPYVGLPYGLSSRGHNTIYNFGDATLLTLENPEDSLNYITEPVTTLDWGGPNIVYYLDIYTSDYIDPNTGQSNFTLDSLDITTLDDSQPIYIDPNPNPNPDTFLDDPTIPILDMEFSLSMVSRVLVFSYIFNFVENAKQFLSSESMLSMKNDITQVKRGTDFVYYEPHVVIDLNSDKSVYERTWKNFEGIDTFVQKNILINDDLSDIACIRLGNGSHNPVYSGIVDVKSFTEEKPYSGCIWIDETTTKLKGRKLIKENQHFDPITKLAIIGTDSGCIAYSTFPEINWSEEINSNLFFDIKLI